MKILVIGVYKDGTGYGQYCIHTIRTLKAANVFDIVARPVRLSNIPKDAEIDVRKHLPTEVIEAENNTLDGVDMIIYNILPNFFQHKKGVINVGSTMYETSHFEDTEWIYGCNQVDHIMVPSQSNFEAFVKSGINPNKLFIQSPGINVEEIRTCNNKIELSQDTENRFIFYFIGDVHARKNLTSLIISYYHEFKFWENVLLFLKVRISGNQYYDTNKMCSIIGNIKELMKLGDYPPIMVRGGYDDNETIYGIHKIGNVFVSLSRGESLGLDGLIALSCGNPIIVPNSGGFKSYADESVGITIPCNKSPVLDMKDGFQKNLYTGREEWDSPDTIEAGKAMRKMYEMGKEDFNKIRKNCIDRSNLWSYDRKGVDMLQQIKTIYNKYPGN